ncbi:MAG TPA: NUDIX hydrolase [Mycobacteriales bacterium]|nr:NUDIX hydrolase [Mycobacteriales bacterium]
MNDVTRATAAIIGDPEGRVLLVQQNHGHRHWGLPGAHIEPADLPTDAVVREVRRETGLETQVVGLVGLYHLTGGDDELPDLLTYAFQCEVVSGEPVLNQHQHGRIGHLGWHAPHAAPSPATATAAAVLADLAAGNTGVVRHLSR